MIFKKLAKAIKSQDLFAIPVQLTYRGEKGFNTFCGGCISVLLIAGLSTYFALSLHNLYMNPDYMVSPRRYDYSGNSSEMRPQDGNTITMMIGYSTSLSDDIHKEARI